MSNVSDNSKKTLVFAGIALASDKHILKGEEGNHRLHGLPPYSLTAMFREASAEKAEFGLTGWKVDQLLNEPQKNNEKIPQEELRTAMKSLNQAMMDILTRTVEIDDIYHLVNDAKTSKSYYMPKLER